MLTSNSALCARGDIHRESVAISHEDEVDEQQETHGGACAETTAQVAQRTGAILPCDPYASTVETDPLDKLFFVYWIVSGTRSYVGATVDPRKRLLQHCGVLQGGAKRTRGRLWTYECVISGLRTWKEALQLEWSVKYHARKCRSLTTRWNAMQAVLRMERWTRNAPLSKDVPVIVEAKPTKYGHPPATASERRPPRVASRHRRDAHSLHAVRHATDSNDVVLEVEGKNHDCILNA
jgi:predicted GIY-YIG superfamily endonuclease